MRFFGKMKSSRVFFFLFFAALAAAAQTGTNTVATRAMSLPDCLQQALQQNFDVQIERYQPQISLYNLRAAYGGYDPGFNISGQHNYDVTPGRFNSVITSQTPPATVRREQFRFWPYRNASAVRIAIYFQRQHFGTIWRIWSRSI